MWLLLLLLYLYLQLYDEKKYDVSNLISRIVEFISLLVLPKPLIIIAVAAVLLLLFPMTPGTVGACCLALGADADVVYITLQR